MTATFWKYLFLIIPDPNGFGIVFCRFQDADGIFQILAYAHHTVSAQERHGTALQSLLNALVDIVGAVFAIRQALNIAKDFVQEGSLIRLKVLICKCIGR